MCCTSLVSTYQIKIFLGIQAFRMLKKLLLYTCTVYGVIFALELFSPFQIWKLFCPFFNLPVLHLPTDNADEMGENKIRQTFSTFSCIQRLKNQNLI